MELIYKILSGVQDILPVFFGSFICIILIILIDILNAWVDEHFPQKEEDEDEY